MTEKMKALVKEEPGPGLTLREVDVPEHKRGEALIRVRAASICGSDYHIYTWDEALRDRVNPPLIAGHEFVGEIVALGEDVSGFRVGDLVTAETHLVCEVCPQCRMNQRHVCIDTQIIGVDVDGCFAEYIALPAGNLWPTDPDLPLGVASSQEPLGNAVHTALAGPVIGARLAVTGCGPIGLMSIPVLRQCGARQVIATEINPYRIELARRLGADAVLDAAGTDVLDEVMQLTDGEGVDGVLEMSGNPTAIDQACKMVRPGGRVSLLGLPSQGEVSLDLGDDVVFKGIDLQGIAGRRMWETWRQMQGLLAGGLDIEEVITHEMPMEEFAAGMRLMESGNCGKVVLIP